MENVITPKFRVSFPKVFEAEKNDLNGKMEYSVVALFPKDADLSALKAAAKACMEEKFGKDTAAWPENWRNPFRDQKEKTKKKDGVAIKGADGKPVLQDGCEAGAIFINLKSTNRPGVVDQNVQPIIDQSEFYSGCWAIAQVRPFYYDQKGNKGVSFGLQNVQKVADGDPLSGRQRAEDAFVPVAGAAAPAGAQAGDPFA